MHVRNRWIDYARAIAIIMIVVGHSNLPYRGMIFLYSFHVQTFFVLSGLFLNMDQPFGQFSLKKTRRLLIPYIAAQIVLNLIAYIFFHVRLPRIDILKEIIYSGGRFGYWFVTPLWFLLALFFGQIFTYFFYQVTRNCKRATRVLLSLAIALIYFVFSNDIPYLPFLLELIPVVQFFLVIGKEYRKEIMEFSVSAWYCVLLLAILLFLIRLNGLTDTVRHSFANPINYLASALIGALFVIGIAHLIDRFNIRLLSFIGRHSLFICIAHPVGFQIAGAIYNACCPSIYETSFVWVVNSILSLLFSCLAAYIIDQAKKLIRKEEPAHV